MIYAGVKVDRKQREIKKLLAVCFLQEVSSKLEKKMKTRMYFSFSFALFGVPSSLALSVKNME